jgi:hypothetical protein
VKPSDRIAGIYALLCEATGHIYIGATADMPQRYARHFERLRLGLHTCRLLQHLFDTHGEMALSWVTLQVVTLPRHPQWRGRVCLRGLGQTESRWLREMRSEVGDLLINPDNRGMNGAVSRSLPARRRNTVLRWPPLPRGGPPRVRPAVVLAR